MKSGNVGVLIEACQIMFSGLLNSKDGRSLETKIRFPILSNLTYETLKGKLPNEKINILLIPTDLTESDGSGAVTVGLFHASGGGAGVGLAGSLGGELLASRFAAGGFTGRLFCTSHGCCC